MPDVGHLHLDGRDFRVATVGEIGIAGDRGNVESRGGGRLSQLLHLSPIRVEDRQVRAFRHQFHGGIAEYGGLGKKTLYVESALPPQSRIADREQRRSHESDPSLSETVGLFSRTWNQFIAVRVTWQALCAARFPGGLRQAESCASKPEA